MTDAEISIMSEKYARDMAMRLGLGAYEADLRIAFHCGFMAGFDSRNEEVSRLRREKLELLTIDGRSYP